MAAVWRIDYRKTRVGDGKAVGYSSSGKYSWDRVGTIKVEID